MSIEQFDPLYEDEIQKRHSAEFPQDIDIQTAKCRIKHGLLYLNCLDDPYEICNERVYIELKSFERALNGLFSANPTDKELIIYKALFKDLVDDFHYGQELNFDGSYREIITLINEENRMSGVRKELPESTCMQPLIGKLEQLGINPAYIITNGDVHAKTVVCFTQLHSDILIAQPLETHKTAIEKSQQCIFDVIFKAVSANLVRDIYGEGIAHMNILEFSTIEAQQICETSNHLSRYSIIQAKAKLGDKINLKGIEEVELHKQIIQNLYTKKAKSLLYDRATAHNIFLARNIAENINSSDQMLAFAVIGFFHEQLINGKNQFAEYENAHKLPISSVLAYYGMNCVVVDTGSEELGKISPYAL